MSLEARVAKIEDDIARILARLDAPGIEPPAAGSASESPRSGEPGPAVEPPVRPQTSLGQLQAAPRFENPLSGKSLEWWLARGGAVLTSLALILLYQYAVERNWITPIVRVAVGIVIGIVLTGAATRLEPPSESSDPVGLRDVLFGAGLAAWYITAYAAAVFYQLIPMSGARLIFLALTIAGAWLALAERQSILAFLAIGVGFLTPALLPSPYPSVTAFALYLTALSALGLLVYLMRGWASVLWLTFIAFWMSCANITELVCCDAQPPRITGSLFSARIALSILAILAGAAMVRVPILRRRLLALGSDRYTSPHRAPVTERFQQNLAETFSKFSGVPAGVDSPAVWVMTVLSPMLAILVLSWTWTKVDGSAWGAASLVLAFIAYRLAMRPRADEVEAEHVEATATAIWSLAGVVWIADSLGSAGGQSSAFVLGGAALYALANFERLRKSDFLGAKRIGYVTAFAAILAVIFSETVFANLRATSYEIPWTIAEVFTVFTAVRMWGVLRRSDEPLAFPSLMGTGAFIALMLMDARILGRIWQPLVTTSFAVAGTAMLMWGRDRADSATVRKLGGFTLLVVVVRLFMIDLARVETIWRVLLFLVCGALFLFTSHRLQVPSKHAESGS